MAKVVVLLQLQQVNEYMGYRNLPKELRHKITDYYDHKYGGKMFNEQAILAELSHTLRAVRSAMLWPIR